MTVATAGSLRENRTNERLASIVELLAAQLLEYMVEPV